MKQFSMVDLAACVLPGFGAFGRTSKTELSVHIKEPIDQITISISGPSEEYLNIYPPVFYDKDGKIIKNQSLISTVKITSRRPGHEEENLKDEIFSGSLIHSGRELRPTLTIKFKSLTYIDKISIHNREDIHHKRSRFLDVKGFRSKTLISSFENSDPQKLLEVYKKISALVKYSPIESESLPDAIDKIKLKIKSMALNGDLELDYKEMLYLLPMFEGVMDPDEYQEAICAAMIIRLLDKKSYAGTRELKVISQFLHSDKIIEKSRTIANEISKKLNGESKELTLSKHQVHYSRLVERKDAHLDGMEKLFSAFSHLGVPLMLSYGTLLGAIRENSFLSHDDDVDLLYVDGSTSHDEILKNQVKLIEKLNSMGIKCGGETLGKNFHVYVDGVSLDLFPCWQTDGRTFLLMEQMKYRDISTNILVPTSTANLHGRSFPAPADPEGFLNERYGSTWGTPDLYYGWPWKVSREVH